MSIPENTSERDPMVHLLGAMSDGTSEYIEGMEAAGQRQLVSSDRLPTDLHSPREEFEELGFTFGDPDPADPMFMPATLPAGWERKGSAHAMWSSIVDERGIERVSIFYKAAFYDRSAHACIANVGGTLASHFLHSEDPDISHLEQFTEAERADFVDRLRKAVGSPREREWLPYVDRTVEWLEANGGLG